MQTKNIFSFFLGTALEAYDNFLFINFLPILSLLFFPSESRFQLKILGFISFSAVYFARPFGCLFFGYLGDRVSRQKAIVVSILLISIFTLFLAILPTFAQIGFFSCFLIFVIRFMQAFCYGGETVGATIFFVEASSSKFLNLSAGLTNCAAMVGGAVASLVSYFILTFQDSSYLWRLAFLGGALLGLVGFYIRLNFLKDEDIELPVKKVVDDKFPLLTVLKTHKFNLLYPMLMTSGVIVPFTIIYLYIPSVMRGTLNVSNEFTSQLNVGYMLLSAVCLPLMGLICDYFGTKRVAYFSLIYLIFVSVFLFYFLYYSLTLEILILTQIMLTLFWTTYACPSNNLVVQSFPFSIRYSALGFSLPLGIIFFSFTPVFLSFFDKNATDISVISYILILTSIICIVSFLKIETKFKQGREKENDFNKVLATS